MDSLHSLDEDVEFYPQVEINGSMIVRDNGSKLHCRGSNTHYGENVPP